MRARIKFFLYSGKWTLPRNVKASWLVIGVFYVENKRKYEKSDNKSRLCQSKRMKLVKRRGATVVEKAWATWRRWSARMTSERPVNLSRRTYRWRLRVKVKNNFSKEKIERCQESLKNVGMIMCGFDVSGTDRQVCVDGEGEWYAWGWEQLSVKRACRVVW